MPLLKPSVNLDPLRAQGRDALFTRDIPEIRHAILREIQFTRNNAYHETITRQARDIFRCHDLHGEAEGVFPVDATPTHAFFDVYFFDSPEPRSILVRVPNTVKLERDADAPVINRWLAARGFIIGHTGEEVHSA